MSAQAPENSFNQGAGDRPSGSATWQVYDTTNLATGPFAQASLRAWHVAQYARRHYPTGDPVRMVEILRVIRTHVIQWPVPVQRFLFRQLATIGQVTPQPSEAAR